MTDTPTIRTHTTTVHDLLHQPSVPADWPDDIEVLVVAGLPEGAELRPINEVPRGWLLHDTDGVWREKKYKANPSYVGLVVCRPVPVPAPPATERVPWHEAIGKQAHYAYETTSGTAAEIKGALFDHPGSPRGFVVDRNRNRICDIDADGMVEVLVEAPTGDDEPQADTPTPEHTPRALDPHVTDPNLDPRCVLDAQHGGPCQPENDDEAPVLDSCGCGEMKLLSGTAATELGGVIHRRGPCHQVDAPHNQVAAERDALRAIVRHTVTYWLPETDAPARDPRFPHGWTDVDWADSGWTDAESAAFRAALVDPVSGTPGEDLTGDCEIDCQERCAYPGQFSECDLGATDLPGDTG